MLSNVLVILAIQAAVAQSASFDVTQVTLSAPSVVAQIDGGKLKGDLVRLAWGDTDGFFLRCSEIDIYQNEWARNFVLAPGSQLKAVPEEPAWAALYWNWKSGYSAPGVPSLRFDIESRARNTTATGSAGGGDSVNPNRSDPGANQIAKDFGSLQKTTTTTVRLKGQTIAELQNKLFVPGVTFSWAPAPIGALAYVDTRRHLVIVDRDGKKLEVPGTTDVLLPAWSPDGKKIAYLQKKDRRTYALMVVGIAR